MVVIRELAENPNLHQPLSAGRELVIDPAGRFAVYLGSGTGPHSATVQRVRLDADEVDAAVDEIRSSAPQSHGRDGSRVGARRVVHACRPGRLASGASGSFRTRTSPSRSGWCWRQEPTLWRTRRAWRPARSTSVDELVTARRIQHEAFGGTPEEVERAQAEADFAAEGIDRIDVPRLRRRGAGRSRVRLVHPARADPLRRRDASRPPVAAARTGPSSSRGPARRQLRGTPVRRDPRGPDVAPDPRAARIHAGRPDRPPARRLLAARERRASAILPACRGTCPRGR